LSEETFEMSQAGDLTTPVAGDSSAASRLDAESAGSGLFSRKSSGLVRGIGVSGAFGLNLGLLSVGGALGYFVIIMTLFPAANVFWSLLIGGLLIATLVWVYGQLATTMPRSGGDYVYQARVFHPIVGAWIGVALLLYMWYTIGSAGSFYSANFIPFVFDTIGSAVHISFLTTLAGDIGTHAGTFITTIIVLLLAIAITLAGARVAARVAYWCVVVGIVGTFVIILELLVHSTSDFQRTFNHLSGSPHAYASVLAQARAHGWKPGATASATFSAIPYAFFVFGGFWWAVYSGGEVKRPARTHMTAQILALGFGVALIVIAWVTMRGSAGSSFMQASAYLEANAPAVFAKITTVTISPENFAAILAGGAFMKCVVALGFLAWVLPGVIALVLGMSRTMFAFSFDRLAPEWLASVSKRHNPLAALGVTVAVCVPLIALVVYSTGFASAFRNLIAIGALIALMASIAVVALPYRRKDLYAASPEVAPGKWLGRPRIVWIGAVAALYLALVLYLTLTKGQYSNGYSTSSVLTLIGIATAGFFVYAIAFAVRRRQGIDLSLAMRELPPD
jgi:basic amino acid/polyamine antiporter, APA family